MNKTEEKHTADRSGGSRKKLWLVIFIAAAAAAGITAGIALYSMQPAAHPEKSPVSADAHSMVSIDGEETSAESEYVGELTQEPQMLPEMASLYGENSDIVGWIAIEGTEVDYPVMYSPYDGEYYVYRNFQKEDDPTKQGCIILDKNCTPYPRGTNLLLHGHNMKNGTMFHTLMYYEDEAYFKSHPNIKYTTLYEEEEYEIIMVFRSKVYNVDDDVFKFYKFYNAGTEEEFDGYISSCKALELYDTGKTAEFGDELLTLTTCEYSQENGRMVVVAKKITE